MCSCISKVSSLLDLGNGHSLKVLAEQARVENVTMRELTEKGFRDAVAIKVLTIVTLVYLPATVVSVSGSSDLRVSCLCRLELFLNSIRQSGQNRCYINAFGGGIQLVDLCGCVRPINRNHSLCVVVLRPEAGI
jgi:hypothetical protein